MNKLFMVGLALTLSLGAISTSSAEEVNMDAPYGDRQPGGYQHMTTHYHNYWRHHHHPWSNIERERQVVREAQDFEKLTRVWEGRDRETFVKKSDEEVRSDFSDYIWNPSKSDFSAELPAYFVEQIKSRPSISDSVRESIRMHELLPKPLNYNTLTYLPDNFTREELKLPDQRFRSALVGNDMILYDVVTGRIRGIWRDIIN